MTYAQHLAENGGLACCGDGLGVMVTSLENINQVPAGWVFIPLEEATEKAVWEALDRAKQGRSSWPKKEPKPSAECHIQQQKKKKAKGSMDTRPLLRRLRARGST